MKKEYAPGHVLLNWIVAHDENVRNDHEYDAKSPTDIHPYYALIWYRRAPDMSGYDRLSQRSLCLIEWIGFQIQDS